MLPALATTTIFTFMWMWNDFFGSLIYLTTPENFTVPLALRQFLDTQGASNWGAMFAMSVVSLVPLFLVFLFGQRFLVKGFATPGTKSPATGRAPRAGPGSSVPATATRAGPGPSIPRSHDFRQRTFMTTRYAVIGTGHRAQMYLDAIAGPHAAVAQLVALIDSNPARREYYRGRFEQFADAESAGPEQLEELIERLAVDRVIVTSPDRLHAEHVVRALDAGADVIVEKPLTIDAPSARRIQEAIDRTGRQVLVTFNYRYSPRNTALKEIIAAGEIGEVVSVVFEWVLDTSHGADYFRRWHRDKANSGGLFIHKSAHQFDLVNWWTGQGHERVYARGGLRFYGRDNAEARGADLLPERGTHDGPRDPFELDLRGDERLKNLYLDAEQHDGYLRDRSVFDTGISTEDNLTAIVDYDRGAVLTYALNAHSPWEGYRVAVNGTAGRAELEIVERAEVIPAADDSAVVDPSAK